ncbi:hypothetical protein SDJN03_08043, partial [Cucurbita argyrosperma subsp. sororia]
MVLCLLELLEQVPPFVSTHSRGAIKAPFPHLSRYLLPQMLVGFRGLRPLLRSLDFMILTTAIAEHHLVLLMSRLWLMRLNMVVAIGSDLDHHISATFFLVNIDWARLIRQVHSLWVRGFREISKKMGLRREFGPISGDKFCSRRRPKSWKTYKQWKRGPSLVFLVIGLAPKGSLPFTGPVEPNQPPIIGLPPLSTFSTALGFCKGNRRFQLWHEEVFPLEIQKPEAPQQCAMEWGVLNEAIAIDRYKSITGKGAHPPMNSDYKRGQTLRMHMAKKKFHPKYHTGQQQPLHEDAKAITDAILPTLYADIRTWKLD